MTPYRRDRPGNIYLVEGPTDTIAMAYAGLACVGRPSNSGGVKYLAQLLRDLHPERRIVVVGENDQKADGRWPGRDGAESVARAIGNQLGRPVCWCLPPSEVKDVREWLTHPDRWCTPWPTRATELAGQLDSSCVVVEPGRVSHEGLPIILIDTDEYRVNDEAIEALRSDPELYQRGGTLVTVTQLSDGVPAIRQLSPATLRERLTRCAHWKKQCLEDGEYTEKPGHPPVWAVKAILARGQWPSIPTLKGIVTHPALLPDGTILLTNGFHAPSGLFVSMPIDLRVEVPECPSRTEVENALSVLLDLVRDFPFAGEEYRAAWLAALLTPLCRFAFGGPSPLFFVDGNVRGIGKGLLLDTIALALTGNPFSVTTYPTDKEELRKQLTTLASGGEQFVLFDNVSETFGNEVLDAALTSDLWKDRLLGTNSFYSGSLSFSWYATGNNVQLRADTSRRICHIRLESSEENPELRSNFRHESLREHVRCQRATVLAAALTILQGWINSGRPRHQLEKWGSFEGWSGVVREAVVFAGLPDPGLTRQPLRQFADRDAANMTVILREMETFDPARRGVTLSEFVSHARAQQAQNDALYSAIEELCRAVDPTKLGYKFRKFFGRNFGGLVLASSSRSGGKNCWVCRRAGEHIGESSRGFGPVAQGIGTAE